MVHTLKCWPQYFHNVKNGTKTFEVRVNDRGFQNGDSVVLREWCPTAECYTAEEPLRFKIGYVLPIDDKRVVFSLLEMS